MEELATPPLDGVILPGVTRQSILEITREWVRQTCKTRLRGPRMKLSRPSLLLRGQGEFAVSERYLTMDQLRSALEQRRVKEMFGCGTACMICPLSQIVYKGEVRHTHVGVRSLDQHLLWGNSNATFYSIASFRNSACPVRRETLCCLRGLRRKSRISRLVDEQTLGGVSAIVTEQQIQPRMCTCGV